MLQPQSEPGAGGNTPGNPFGIERQDKLTATGRDDESRRAVDVPVGARNSQHDVGGDVGTQVTKLARHLQGQAALFVPREPGSGTAVHEIEPGRSSHGNVVGRAGRDAREAVGREHGRRCAEAARVVGNAQQQAIPAGAEPHGKLVLVRLEAAQCPVPVYFGAVDEDLDAVVTANGQGRRSCLRREHVRVKIGRAEFLGIQSTIDQIQVTVISGR